MKSILSLAATLLATSTAVLAGNHAYGPFPVEYLNECGSCHVAYPPQLLTGPSWQAVMNGLDRHYGVDASLTEKRRAAIADYLRQNASLRQKHNGQAANAAASQLPRLTSSSWFRKEHGSLPGQVAQGLPAAAQCESCHTAAERGDYNESGLQLPAAYRSLRHKER